MTIPLVTVAIPTYNRPDVLRRALRSVARQGLAGVEVIVSDNATPGDVTREAVAAFSHSIPGIRYIRHDLDIGPLANFQFLLREARGEYFMWLADDDEISEDYIATLVRILDTNPPAASAAGNWMLMSSAHEGRLMRTSHFPQRTALARCLRFVWNSDDAFFYALHRTRILRQATFPGYVWPNREAVMNWAYVYLMDVVLQGQILIASDPSVRFINHDYTRKEHVPPRLAHFRGVAYVIRRLNVHALYWLKSTRVLGLWCLPLVACASLGSLAREGIAWVPTLMSRQRRPDRATPPTSNR